MCTSGVINSIAKSANFSNTVARELEFEPHDDRNNNEHNGVGFVEISEIFAAQVVFFFGTELFNRALNVNYADARTEGAALLSYS